jgi:malate/lactate dehydrogenase
MIIEYRLNEQEKAALNNSAEAVKQTIEALKALVDL